MTRAACRAADPELFFPISEQGPGALQIAEATAICRGCPVRDLCLSYALATGQEAGIWGGLTPRQRRALRPRTYRAQRPAGARPEQPGGGAGPIPAGRMRP